MNILMTGGTGFLGRHLLKRFVNKGDKVYVLVRSSSRINSILEFAYQIKLIFIESNDLEKVFAEKRIDAIVHCATDYGRSSKNTWQILEPNLILPVKLLELANRHNVSVFFNTDTVLDKRISDYAMSKSHFSDWLQSFSENLVAINFRLEHFYGPGDDITKFVSMAIRTMLSKQKRFPLTQGMQKRDFIYIDDVCDAAVLILDKAKDFSNGYYEYEVGSGELVSIKNLVKLIKEFTKSKIELGFGDIEYRDNEHMSVSLKNSHLRALGWAPKVSLRDGLIKTIKYEKEIE